MPAAPPARKIVRFGVFEVDLRAGELWKQGRKLRLQEQQLQILAMLLEHRDDLVTREQLRQRLWSADTFVDFDHSLNTAIKRLRDVLGDSAEHPRFVETVARRGYRFIAPIEEPSEEPQAVAHQHEPAAVPSPRRGRRASLVVASLALAAVVITTWAIWWSSRQLETRPIRLAVLPFVNLSSNSDNEYFSDGLTEEIIQSLSVIDGLEVTSRTSSFALKGARVDIPEAASRLNVSLLLEGSVRRTGDQLRISAQLISAADGAHVWSSTYERQLRDVFAIQEDIAGAIANTLRLKLGSGPRRYTNNLDAYELYLQGRHALDRAQGGVNALQYFEQAIAKDAGYALAYAGVADAVLAMHMGLALPYEQAHERSKAAAEKALQLDPMLSEAQSALAMVYGREEYAWSDSEKAYRRAIALDPNNALAHLELGNPLLVVLGRFDEAVAESRRAAALDPLSGGASAALAETLLLAGRYDEAIDQGRKATALDPSKPDGYVVVGRALYSAGRHAEALSVMHEADVRTLLGGSTGWLACADVRANRREEALHILDLNLRGAYRKPTPARNLVRIYACLGDREHAFQYLEQMYAEHQPGLPVFFQYPELAWLRSDRRFALLRQKVGLGVLP
jgi:TolB-like protein/DNA-binding winged helix-turn-helix (wHTH) protein/Tfp pilus assembly protein PilF